VYRTNPHVDTAERGFEATGILSRIIRGEIDPVQHLVQVPMIINITKQPTATGAMKAIMDDVAAVIATPGVITASCGQGFPYADVEQMGVSFLVVTDGNQERAKELAEWLAQRAWNRRDDLLNDATPVDEAIRLARYAHESEQPTVLLDVGDNVGGGGTADSTHLLAEAIRQELNGQQSLLMSLFDPESVQTCVVAGQGSEVRLQVGAKTDELHGKPITIAGKVKVITDGKFEESGQIHGGWKSFDYGPSVAVDTDNGHTIVLHTARGVGNMSRHQYYSMGISPEDYKTIICKGTVSPRPAYEPIAGKMIVVDTPGVTSADMSSFDYKNRRKPLYPFELETTLR
jgi:microcystin degradation protein MlrC